MRTLILKDNFFLAMHTRNTLGTQSDAMHQRFVHRATHSFIRSLIRPPSLVQFTYVHACTSRTAFTSIICLLAHSFILKHSVRQSSSKSGKHHRATTSHCFLSSSRIRASGARSWGLRRPWPPSFAKCNLHWDALRSRMSRVNRSTPVLQTNLHSSPLLHSHMHVCMVLRFYTRFYICMSVWSLRNRCRFCCEPPAHQKHRHWTHVLG